MSKKEEGPKPLEVPTKFWITKSRYLQQHGQTQPHYVEASPNNPALVTLPAGTVPDRHLKKAADQPTPPEKPKTNFNKKQSALQKAESQQAVETSGASARAADQ